MKKLLLILACSMITGTTLLAQTKTGTKTTAAGETTEMKAHDGLKIGFINSTELLSSMPERVKADTDISRLAREYQGQIEGMMKEYQTKVKKYQDEEKTMSDAIKEVKAKEIQDLQNRIESTQQSAREKVEQKKQDLYQPVLEKADKAIKAVAKEKDFDFIFDANAGGMLFGRESYNITSLVKAKLGIK